MRGARCTRRPGAGEDLPWLGRLLQSGPRRIYIADLTRDGVCVVRSVQAHERLALVHRLATIDQALDDFARDAKAEITLDAS